MIVLFARAFSAFEALANRTAAFIWLPVGFLAPWRRIMLRRAQGQVDLVELADYALRTLESN